AGAARTTGATRTAGTETAGRRTGAHRATGARGHGAGAGTRSTGTTGAGRARRHRAGRRTRTARGATGARGGARTGGPGRQSRARTRRRGGARRGRRLRRGHVGVVARTRASGARSNRANRRFGGGTGGDVMDGRRGGRSWCGGLDERGSHDGSGRRGRRRGGGCRGRLASRLRSGGGSRKSFLKFAYDGRLDGRGRRTDELTQLLELGHDDLALNAEILGEFVDPDLCHSSPFGARGHPRSRCVNPWWCSAPLRRSSSAHRSHRPALVS
ncbi:MAG: hypothetical protein QOC60_1356, partial [Frankiaceae bacterium]|nr:hypothetical protein [Frankiaceae bacterium]